MRAFDVRINANRDGSFLVRGSDVYELDDVGAQIWQDCDGSRSVAQIADRVAQRYGIEGETALADTTEYIDQLREARLLEA
jgi:hypothetical protein